MRRIHVIAVVALVLAAMLVASCGGDSEPVGDDEGVHSTPIEGNVVFPAAWSGTWQTILTFTDCNSNHVTVVEDVLDTICESDTLDLPISRILDGCEGVIDDRRIDAGCEYSFGVSACNVTVSFFLHLERDGDEVAGSGVWTVETAGSCPLEYSAGCERVTITGTRIEAGSTPCDGSVLTAQSLAAHAGMILRRTGGGR